MTAPVDELLPRLEAAAWHPAPEGPGPRIGFLGADIPVELLRAAGAVPVALRGDPGLPMEPGDRYLGRGLDPQVRSILTRILQGAFGTLDALTVSGETEAGLRLFYALRELRRTRTAELPPLQLLDVQHLDREPSRVYTTRTVTRFAERLAEWTGTAPEGERLRRSVAEGDRMRERLRALDELRRAPSPRLSGTAYLTAVAAAATGQPAVAAVLDDLIAAGPGLDELAGRRVFLTGSGHDEPAVYRAIEAEGVVVVGEDHPGGRPAARGAVGDGTLDAIARYLHANGPFSHRASIGDRAAFTADGSTATGADVVLSYARVRDDAPRWDAARLPAALTVPMVRSHAQEYGRIDLAALRTALAEVAA